MSIQKSSLKTLVDLADKEAERAAERLGEANKQLQETQNKLEMLLNYRKDYMAKLSSTLGAGVSMQEYQNFQHFLRKLDQAILGQEEFVVLHKQKAEFQRKCWQESQRKKLSYGVLVMHSDKKEHAAALKKDQKMMDEHAMRVTKTSTK